MGKKKIKESKFESKLKYLLPIILGSMEDEKINKLSIIDVVCSTGRYNVKIYLDASILTIEEQKESLKQLSIASHYIKSSIQDNEGWFRTPNIIFEFDTLLEKLNNIDSIFKEIKTPN